MATPVLGREETEVPLAADAPCCSNAKRDTAGPPEVKADGDYGTSSIRDKIADESSSDHDSAVPLGGSKGV